MGSVWGLGDQVFNGGVLGIEGWFPSPMWEGNLLADFLCVFCV